MSDKIHEIADAVKAQLAAQNIPISTGMQTFTQWEEELEAQFDAFHEGRLSKHNLKLYLLTKGYSKDMVKAEISEQIKVANFKNAAKARELADKVSGG